MMCVLFEILSPLTKWYLMSRFSLGRKNEYVYVIHPVKTTHMLKLVSKLLSIASFVLHTSSSHSMKLPLVTKKIEDLTSVRMFY